MKEFKYSLSKKGKHICPNCSKKTFVIYIDNENGNEMQGFGRCDREQSCAFHKRPDENETIFIPKKIEEIKQKTDYLSLELLDKYYSDLNNCNLSKFLYSKFTDEKVKFAKKIYLISNLNSETIFWQIDQLERVRSGKVMQYNPYTGKRIKDENGKAQIRWMHKKPFNLKQCLFGLHLTKEEKNKTIAIVESEKTALIMSIYVPNFIWLATGSKSGFKIELLSSVKFRKIIAFPDKGCFNEWQEKAIVMNAFGFNITVSDLIENEDCLTGEDIADIYLKL